MHLHQSSHHQAFSYSIILNVIFVVIEVFFGLYADSMGLIADAWHNLGDILGLTIAFGASLLHARPSTDRFSYGFKRSTIMASLINALFLVATSAIIGYQSVLKLFQPETFHVQEMAMIWVALLGVFINGSSALLFFKKRKEDLNIKGAFLHLLNDAFMSMVVVITGIIIHYTHWRWMDGLAGIVIVIVIIASTWELLRESIILMLDAVPSQNDQEKIKKYLENIEGVQAIHDLHVWALSTCHTALTAHLVMPLQSLTAKDFSKINEDMKKLYRVDHVTLQIEKGEIEHPCPQENSC